ncbi:YqzK family protein [Bacillus sp. A301a_S52]|jgi:hypothetical protein|nr:YqzK family protein [Bacillus sp. A301a_S52]
MMTKFKQALHTLWIFFLFIGCTVLFYYGILWVGEEYREYHRYEEPQGRAVKVFNSSIEDDVEGNFSIADRLRLFFITGE